MSAWLFPKGNWMEIFMTNPPPHGFRHFILQRARTSSLQCHVDLGLDLIAVKLELISRFRFGDPEHLSIFLPIENVRSKMLSPNPHIQNPPGRILKHTSNIFREAVF